MMMLPELRSHIGVEEYERIQVRVKTNRNNFVQHTLYEVIRTANQNYAICLEQYNTDRVSIVKNAENTDSTGTLLASTALTYVTGWYEVEVAWGTDDSINVTLSQNGSTVATVSTSDGTFV